MQQLVGHRLQHFGAPQHARQHDGQIVPRLGAGRTGRRPARVRQRRQEAVATPGNGGDVALAIAAIAERLAQRRQMHAQGRVVDHGIGPDDGHQFMLVDDVAGALQQGQQQVHGPAAQAQRAFALEQQALQRQKAKRAEDIGRGRTVYHSCVGE
ncbi:hypothetical protein D3C81_1420060 [compost metagenome]